MTRVARLRWSGGLIAGGLLAEIAVSAWVHPLAFVSFAVVSCPLVVAGMAMFVWSLRRQLPERRDQQPS